MNGQERQREIVRDIACAVHIDLVVETCTSRDFLRSIATTRATAETAAFLYLDAHGTSDLPLPEEVEIVVANWPKAIVMIDDFKVPGDDGYGFDNYGLEKALTADVLPKDLLDGWRFLYPTAPSTTETGAVRGCVVLISPLIAEVADCIPSLTSR